MTWFPKYSDIPEDIHVLEDPGYRGKWLLPGPIDYELQGQWTRSTTPQEERRIEEERRQAREAVMKVSRVYFVQQGDKGPIKIGVTRNVPRRLHSLQLGSPEKLHLLGVLPGTRQEEQQLHEKFSAYRLRGEWFEPHTAIFEFISTLKGQQ